MCALNTHVCTHARTHARPRQHARTHALSNRFARRVFNCNPQTYFWWHMNSGSDQGTALPFVAFQCESTRSLIALTS